MHPCPISVCEEPVPDDKLMCKTHWFMVPERLRNAVWRAYHQHGAKRTDGNLAMLRAAQKTAVDAVEEQLDARSQRRAPA